MIASCCAWQGPLQSGGLTIVKSPCIAVHSAITVQLNCQVTLGTPLDVQDPVGDVAKKALAAVAAATIALSPLAANAGPLDSVLNQVCFHILSCRFCLSTGRNLWLT